jgi:orotate phosphoribosyltransferase-like protein
MGHLKTEVRQAQIDWRRQKVLELASDGFSNREISSQLKILHATVDRDVLSLRAEAKQQIHKYITEQVPFEYKKTLAGLEGIIKYMSSIISDDAKDTKEKMQAASIKMQALNMKMELVSSANLVEEAIDLVERYRGYTSTSQKGEQTLDYGTAEST